MLERARPAPHSLLTLAPPWASPSAAAHLVTPAAAPPPRVSLSAACALHIHCVAPRAGRHLFAAELSTAADGNAPPTRRQLRLPWRFDFLGVRPWRPLCLVLCCMLAARRQLGQEQFHPW